MKLWPDRKYRLEDYPPLAEVPPKFRRRTVALLHRRDAENTEVRRMPGDFALAFGRSDAKTGLSKIWKLRRIEEITRPHLAVVKRRSEKERSLDLFGSFWVNRGRRTSSRALFINDFLRVTQPKMNMKT